MPGYFYTGSYKLPVMNIGFLSPRSDAHPAIALDFTAGLKLFLKEKQRKGDIQLFTESIGFGGSEKEVYEKAEKLLMIDDADILLAFIDERVLDILKPLLYASGKLMIVINAGANYPMNWVPQENIIYLTLQHAFCNWLTGITAAKHSQQAATATTFYDGGYLHGASIVKAYAKHGGEIGFNFVNNDKYDESFSVAPLTAFLAEHTDTRSVLCTFDSLPASLVYAAIDKAGSNEGLQLFVSPMMVEPPALEHIGEGFSFSIEGHAPWNIQEESENNKTFIRLYKENNKKLSPFSLLGWETGMIAVHILEHAADQLADGSLLVNKLKEISFGSPRGTLVLDPETNFFLAPVYQCSIGAGSSAMKMVPAVDPEKEWKNFVEEPTTGPVSGWTNTYLCY